MTATTEQDDFVLKPHRLTAQVTRWGELEFTVECPYTEFHPERPCRMGMEADPACAEYEAGNDCPHGGFYGTFGDWGAHVHPTNACFVQFVIGEVGFGDAVRWIGDPPTEVTLPIDIDVYPDGEGYVEIAPVENGSEPQPRCDSCGAPLDALGCCTGPCAGEDWER